ncbi:hypothetical protein EJ04DRAFT_578392 [Polyplosphaeria fusca]|uniref:Uncharacterized protein n=1 Tax=Polyplosphaeria fusca TaxID=682080 RepID=A0A9P4QWY5_9PLEO|nr:hypothetical protein EJ04DRAFT_578392 [Polyplosphaeria fusca]
MSLYLTLPRDPPSSSVQRNHHSPQPPNRTIPNSPRRNENTPPEDVSNYRLIKDGGWDNKHNFMPQWEREREASENGTCGADVYEGQGDAGYDETGGFDGGGLEYGSSNEGVYDDAEREYEEGGGWSDGDGSYDMPTTPDIIDGFGGWGWRDGAGEHCGAYSDGYVDEEVEEGYGRDGYIDEHDRASFGYGDEDDGPGLEDDGGYDGVCDDYGDNDGYGSNWEDDGHDSYEEDDGYDSYGDDGGYDSYGDDDGYDDYE